MNENRKLIQKLIPYINSTNPIRRKGIINMIRNIMLDEYYWDKLVDNWDVDGYLKEIVYRLCANLNGDHLIEGKVLDPIVYQTKKEREKVMFLSCYDILGCGNHSSDYGFDPDYYKVSEWS